MMGWLRTIFVRGAAAQHSSVTEDVISSVVRCPIGFVVA